MIEIWKTLKKNDNYSISNYGNVKRAIAKKFDISRSNISFITNGKTW